MSTLLLRLSGPMQSWGTDSRFELRFTGTEPSKSGVIGLLCAALGKPREEQLGDSAPTLARLSGLRMGVRIERPGRLLADYQTAGSYRRSADAQRYGIVNALGRILPNPVPSTRYYLADACFLVGLSGKDEPDDEALLRQLFDALVQPVWQIYLGRKAFVPSEPVFLPDASPGTRWWQSSLEDALRYPGGYPWIGGRGTAGGDTADGQEQHPPGELRAVIESESSQDAELRQDVPLDFATRRFGVRFVRNLPA
ncbi:MAG TPA: type I-E CRISPR-associated protein Cas5/CasD, partial [Dehalococcoidia bacterium]|nr:type I-E CRISPR-associated protein Cas5/CasD [Dehalococcoidia bacterium]